jgi:hydroxymethylpyrimidine pyrophosphatase-like HAD family hydrolase
MPLRIRVLYADVDGTMVGPLGNLLWDSQRHPTVAAAEALVRAAREGLEVVALTGRARAGMFEFARVLGLQSWICELGGIRVYDRGETVVHEHGAFPGGGVPTQELHRAVDLLLAAYPGRLEEHSPWNAARESSFLLRGEVSTGEAEERLADAGFGWATLVDNGVIPRRFEHLTEVERVRAYHLLPRGVSKVSGVAGDRAQRGLAREECAMVGDAAADLDCRDEVGRCFLVRNGLEKDPSLAWVTEPGSGVEVTKATHGEGFAEVVHRLLDEA